jgi:hypothetical protein
MGRARCANKVLTNNLFCHVCCKAYEITHGENGSNKADVERVAQLDTMRALV